MKPEVYAMVLMQIGAMGSIAADLPLEDAQAALSKADSLGAVLDPSAYRTALADGTIEMQREMLNAALALKRATLRCRALAEGRQSAKPLAEIQRNKEPD
jgi:hypothetical protein